MASERRVIDYRAGVANVGMEVPSGVKIPWRGQGQLVHSSLLAGREESTSSYPASAEGEVAMLFRHIAGFMEAAAGSVNEIIDLTVYVADEITHTPLVRQEFERIFTDPDYRPSFHVFNAAPVGLKEGRFAAVVVACVKVHDEAIDNA